MDTAKRAKLGLQAANLFMADQRAGVGTFPGVFLQQRYPLSVALVLPGPWIGYGGPPRPARSGPEGARAC